MAPTLLYTQPMSLAGTLGRLAICTVLGSGAGCTVRTYPPAADAYVYVGDSPPPDIYTAPRGYYNGNTTYWYGNRWWYQSPRGWGYFREEPRELQRYRSGVQQPPPARPHGYGGGPGYGGPPYGAPPPLPAPRR